MKADGGRWQIVGEFVEVESGKRASRPQLDAAIAVCKKHKANLIVAKLDRLSRNVSFLLKLIEAGVDVLFADLPELNGAMGKFVLITMANVAELEAGLRREAGPARRRGGYSMRRMATELTKRKVKAPRGGTWHPQTVKMVMQRLAA